MMSLENFYNGCPKDYRQPFWKILLKELGRIIFPIVVVFIIMFFVSLV